MKSHFSVIPYWKALSLGCSDSLALVMSATSSYNPFSKILTSYNSDFLGGFPAGSVGNESAPNEGDAGSTHGQEDPLGEEMTTHSSLPAWRIPWTEDPGGLQCMSSPRVGHEWVTNTHYSCTLIFLFLLFLSRLTRVRVLAGSFVLSNLLSFSLTWSRIAHEKSCQKSGQEHRRNSDLPLPGSIPVKDEKMSAPLVNIGRVLTIQCLPLSSHFAEVQFFFFFCSVLYGSNAFSPAFISTVER